MSSPSSRTRQIGYCGHFFLKQIFSSTFTTKIHGLGSSTSSLKTLFKMERSRSLWEIKFSRRCHILRAAESKWIPLRHEPGREIQWLTKSCCFDLWKRYADRSICKCKQIAIIALFATRLLLRSMDDYIPQLKRYFLNRCFATVQNENLRRTGTPPIPKPITMLFPAVPHLTPVPPLSLLHPNSSPVYTPVVSSPVQFKKPSHSTQSCAFLHPRQDFWVQLQSMWWHLRVPYVEPCWGGIPSCQTRWTGSAEGLMEWMK